MLLHLKITFGKPGADVPRAEFASEKQNYWSRDQQGHSEWQEMYK